MKIQLEFTCENYKRTKLIAICSILYELFDDVVFTKIQENIEFVEREKQ